MKSPVITSALLLMLAGSSALAFAQSPTPKSATQGQATGEELYHVRFVKAAPGQLAALWAAELKAPPDPDNPEPPIILRHAQGDDWQLLVISPLGKDETIRAEAPPPALQEYFTKIRTLSARHDDTIAQGPAWAEAKKVLLGDGGAGGVYLVGTFEAVPGHRDQLLAGLKEGPPGSTAPLILTHREGASWTFLTIERYPSWAALGEMMQKQVGAGPSPVSEHLAAHHDTITVRLTAVP
jgi:hypothetical protein